MAEKRYVIIGNSAAAVGCIEGIRQYDQSGAITVISREPYHTYSRPLISYLLGGKTDEERMKYRPDDFYEKNHADLLTGAEAVHIDAAGKEVRLKDGRTVGYDKLLVAAGSVPFVPPMEGLDTVENRCTFLSLDDAHKLEQMITPDARVLILGAGLIGLKCAEGIADRVGSITVVDLADRILPSVLDAHAAQIVQNHLEEHGVQFVLKTSAKRFEKNKATLSNGQTVTFDLLVVAVGVRPNVGLLKDVGAQIGRGIHTDAHMQTSLPDIYAAGDCTESRDVVTGEDRVLALLPNAYMQGECAGVNMAGGDKPYDKAAAMNAVGFFGLHILTAGDCIADGDIVEDGASYKKLVTDGETLRGFILIGDVARAGIYTSLVRERTPLSQIDYPRIRENPSLIAFSKQERARVLGGITNEN